LVITGITIVSAFNMPTVFFISRPDVVAHIETPANRLTGGDKTEVVALALRTLEERTARSGSLFGAHRGSVTLRKGLDLTAPILDDPMDAECGPRP